MKKIAERENRKTRKIERQRHIKLTEEEMLCIRWHMGAFDEKENWNSYGRSVTKYQNVLWTHHADMYAARVLQV